MKKIWSNSISNIQNTDIFDNIFLFDILDWWGTSSPEQKVEIIFLSDLLEKRKNFEMLEKSKSKPASYSNVYSPQDELAIFRELFQEALTNKKKIHIVWITLGEEVVLLEEYYMKLWFFNEEINCFEVDFSEVLISSSVKIENIQWRGSDYKRMKDTIFFNPPVRESWQVKAMFKGINRGVIAGLHLGDSVDRIWESRSFLSQQILEEHILPLTLWKILYYNLVDTWIVGNIKNFSISY